MKIQNAINEDNLIIFVGAGLSRNLGLPTWNEMVIKIINNVNKENLKHFIPLLESNIMSALDVLEYLKNDANEVYSYIQNSFKVDQNANVNLQKKLLKLSNNKIITTNYDNAFELASNYTIHPSCPISKYNINNINKSHKDFIFKLHGNYADPDKCIIFKDDYFNLYSDENNQAGPEKLKSLFTNSTFLFVGFGFNDPDIDYIFNKMDKTFGGFNKHYIITQDIEKFEKYSFLEVIQINSYLNLEGKIDELIKYKDENPLNHDNLKDLAQNYDQKESKKVAILYPDIIDQNYVNEYKSTINLFEDLNVDTFVGNLNLSTLNLVDNYDLLIILSNTYKQKIYIEEPNLKSNLLNIDEIVDNIPNWKIPILLLTNEEIDISHISNPIINIFQYKNQTIKKFLYKVINEKKFIFNDLNIKNNTNNWYVELEKGKSIRKNFYGNNRNLDIGKKCLTEIIGRIEEQCNIISRFLLINSSNKILNIKASGGLGKTTLVKKISYELYNRGYYKNGVNFKSCENIKSFDDFEEILIEGFNLANILNFRDHLIENYSNEKIDLLLILDNFETVINNLNNDDYLKVIELLELASDYSNIVITSRDVISTREFEEVFTLTPMTTDDALELFKQNYNGIKNYTTEEIKILRVEVLEDLLANNPLAIKLVTTSRPQMKIDILRDQIKDHFFETINEEFSDVFKNNADLNIERTKSIYQSINYSYTSLNARQKLAFELLSLFPDGINLSDFKICFQKSQSSNKITDTEIKQLENKSLLENYNGTLQLQPIIRRFADFQFNKHKENRQKYCIDAYIYNCYTLEILEQLEKKSSRSLMLKVFSSIKNNLLQVLEYIPDIQILENSNVTKKEFLLNYIYNLDNNITNQKNLNYFEKKLLNLIDYFKDIQDSNKLIETLVNRNKYYYFEFDNSYEEMSKYFTVSDMENRIVSEENYIEVRWKDLISSIHSMEGNTISFIKSMIINKRSDHVLFSYYHYLGIEDITFSKKHDSFYYYENQLRTGNLIVKELKEYTKNLFMEEHLQIMQCTYVLSKLDIIPIREIKKLVVTNPYTKGLKNLMMAFNSKDEYDIINFYKKAIYNLQHIKYYYLEAHYYYAKYLKLIGSDEYESILDLGLTLSQNYKFQYLEHLFSNLKNETSKNYAFSYNYYGLHDLEDFVNLNMKEWNNISTE